jgi:hypothetical protein
MPPVAFSDWPKPSPWMKSRAAAASRPPRVRIVVQQRDVVLAAVHERPEDARVQVAREDRHHAVVRAQHLRGRTRPGLLARREAHARTVRQTAAGGPALVVSDSDALTPYMSHVVPGCEFLFATTTDESVRRPGRLMFVVPARSSRCERPLGGSVAAIESIDATNRPSLPRRSLRSTYSMQPEPAPPNAVFFHRSGSTPNCCQRCWSVEPSRAAA